MKKAAMVAWIVLMTAAVYALFWNDKFVSGCAMGFVGMLSWLALEDSL